METNLAITESKDEFFSQLKDKIYQHYSDPAAAEFCHLVALYYDRFPIHELEGRQLQDIFGSLCDWWRQLQDFKIDQPQVRVFNPTVEESGWVCGHTVVTVLCKDMPFLVDSIRIEINRRNIPVYTINNTVIVTQRDKQRRLQRIDTALSQQDKASEAVNQSDVLQREALVYFEINLNSDEAELKELQKAIASVLQEIDLVVSSYDVLVQQCEQTADQLALGMGGNFDSMLKESEAFLRWLAARHFTFLGYSEYDFVEQDGQRVLVENASKRLGVFQVRSKNHSAVALDDFNNGMTRFHLTPNVLAFSKSSVRSRVHRHAYSDYVIVKRYDKTGQVCGESRFLGLYTSSVFVASPDSIPVIRVKAREILARADIDPMSHYGRGLRRLLETFPREELFQCSTSELFETLHGVAQINERHQVRVFMRKDPYGKFISFLVYTPRDVFSTVIREKIQAIITDTIDAIECEQTTYYSESILARTHFFFRVKEDATPEFDKRLLESKIIDITRTWGDHLETALLEFYGEEQGTDLIKNFNEAFSNGYQESYDARIAVHDIATLKELEDGDDIAMSFYRPVDAEENELRFKVFHPNTALELSDVIPVLENMGLRVLGEHPYKIKPRNSAPVWLHDFTLLFSLPVHIDIHAVSNTFKEAFEAVWRKKAESDQFNRLVIGARLNWREVAVLRAYARYMQQTAFYFTQSYIADTLAHHLEITRNLVALFKSTFDLRVNQDSEQDRARIERLVKKVTDALEKVDNLNEDTIIRRYLDLIKGTLRTNFYQIGANGEFKEYVCFKFSPRDIPDIPEPRPMFEIFVYSPRVEGVHLRGSKVARGGLRWSDRLQDYRTEVLGLVKAQQVKNSVIVPSGAKGGFVVKQPPPEGGRKAMLEEGIACYRIFIQALLDVTDNIVEGEIVSPSQVICLDDNDPYLVVAADKGTATFSDIANEISLKNNHWLGDAFASGGSQGYDHKQMGITARGAWISVQRHFKEIGINVQTEDFTVIGIGDMAGDVFGNGMLMSEHICLVAAFNHLHIFIDPTPDAQRSFQERKRLFESDNGGWDQYEKSLISQGGGVFSRSAKSIDITPEMQKTFAISETKLTPTQLLNRLLKAPVGLIWNGGIGTYIKAKSETHSDVGDKANDALRVNGGELKCKVLGEGGNLGATQLGRIEFALNGGAVNTDFIDNAAGVDCSDHEVNIKILLGEIVRDGDMTEKQRNNLLAEMTDNVAALVLHNNYKQTQAISIAQQQAGKRFLEYLRVIRALESSGQLNRSLEFLPDDESILERNSQGKHLTRPEISILISYVKVMLKDALATDEIATDQYLAKMVENIFPEKIRASFSSAMYSHRLRKEIIATQLANDMVNNMGISFCHRLMESTGVNAVAVAKAYSVARDVFGLEDYRSEVEALDFKVDVSVQFDLLNTVMRRVRRGTRWFLRNRRSELNPSEEVELYQRHLDEVVHLMPGVLNGKEKELWQSGYDKWIAAGLSDEMARATAMVSNLYSGLSIVEAARISEVPIKDVATLFFLVAEHLNLNWFASQISEVPVENYWQAMARETYLDDLEVQMRTITVAILQIKPANWSLDQALAAWSVQHSILIARWKSMMNDLQSSSGADFAMFSVAIRELLDLAQASKYCSSLETSECEEP